MSEYIDLLISANDLVFDPSNQPMEIEDRASIAQDIAHMIRESGLLVTLIAERNSLRQRDCIQQLELMVEADERLVPGTARITQPGYGQYLIEADTIKFGSIEVAF